MVEFYEDGTVSEGAMFDRSLNDREINFLHNFYTFLREQKVNLRHDTSYSGEIAVYDFFAQPDSNGEGVSLDMNDVIHFMGDIKHGRLELWEAS